MKDTTKGVLFGLGAYSMWGGFPLFFALFDAVPAFEVLIHRIIWSCVFLAVIISLLRRWSSVRAAFRAPKRLGWVFGCAVLIALNWGVYIYAVESRQVLQASLGYFLTPLVNVALGMLFLKERLQRWQSVAVLLAAMGILLQLVWLGTLPLLTLVLAGSFGTYGLLRKQVPLDGLTGLFVETMLLLPLGLLAFAWLSHTGDSNFAQESYLTALLVASGILTAIPLLLFAGAARRLRLATVGFLMYINPSLQFVIALLVFKEPLHSVELVSFIVIWSALALYSWSSWHYRERESAPQSA